MVYSDICSYLCPNNSIFSSAVVSMNASVLALSKGSLRETYQEFKNIDSEFLNLARQK